MRHIKNFLHNINDIVLALIIVALAAGIIYWRMQIILDYPKQLADEQANYSQETAEEETSAEDPGRTADQETQADAEEQSPAAEADGQSAEGETPAEESAEGQPKG